MNVAVHFKTICFMCISACLNMCMCTMSMSGFHEDEGVRGPGTGVIVGCKLLYARNKD